MKLIRIAKITDCAEYDTILAQVTVNDFLTGAKMSPVDRHPWVCYHVAADGTLCGASIPASEMEILCEAAMGDTVTSEYGHRVFIVRDLDDVGVTIEGTYDDFQRREGGAYTDAADDLRIRRMVPKGEN